MTHRPRRSVLYMPGAYDRALEKARTLDADALILDLEDSVAPDSKAEARAKVLAAIRAGGYGRRELVIRINGLDSPWGIDDLRMAAEASPDAVLVPKVARPGDIVNVSRIYGGLGGAETTRMWAMMETPMSIFNVREIASVHQVARLSCLVLGTNDLLKESRALATGGRFAILPLDQFDHRVHEGHMVKAQRRQIVTIPAGHCDAVLADDRDIAGCALAEHAAGGVPCPDRHHVIAANDRIRLGASQQRHGFLEA